jgi:hypothetical protein
MLFNFRPDFPVPGFRVGLSDKQDDLPFPSVPLAVFPADLDYDPAAEAMQVAAPSISDLIAASPYLAGRYSANAWPDPAHLGDSVSGPTITSHYSSPSWRAAALPTVQTTEPAGSAGSTAPTAVLPETLSWPRPQGPGNVTAVRYAPGEGSDPADRIDMMTSGWVPLIPGDNGSPADQTPQAGLRIDRSPGNVVVLPDGSDIEDADSVTGKLMSPVSDLSAVAAAGRQVGSTYAWTLRSPQGGAGALPYLATMLGLNVGQGGKFDYQRRGSRIGGYTHLPQFANVSNLNVGLFSQQAGLTLEETLWIAGKFACNFSSNSDPSKPYCLSSGQLKYITDGFKLGESGVFGPRANP